MTRKANAKAEETKRWQSTRLGRHQMTELQSRLNRVVSGAYYLRGDDDEIDETAEIQKARKLIEAYEKRRTAARQRRRDAAEPIVKRARDAIFFAASPSEAFATVKRLEALAVRRRWIKA